MKKNNVLRRSLSSEDGGQVSRPAAVLYTPPTEKGGSWLPETKGESTGKRPEKKHAPGVKVNRYEPALQRPTLNFLFFGSRNKRFHFQIVSKIYEMAVTFSGLIITTCSVCDPLL